MFQEKSLLQGKQTDQVTAQILKKNYNALEKE